MMSHLLRTYFWAFTGLFLLYTLLANGCIKELDLNEESLSQLVIDGVISSSAGGRSLRVVRVYDFGTRSEPVSCRGWVLKEGDRWAELVSDSVGFLRLPARFQLEAGTTYEVEVEAESQLFRSQPQELQATLRTSRLSFELDQRLEGENSEGLPREVNVVDVFAHVAIAPGQANQYFRWELEEAWIFREITKPAVDTFWVYDTTLVFSGFVLDTMLIDSSKAWNPDTVKDCYLRAAVTEHPSVLHSSNEVEAGEAKVRITTREVDQSFLWEHYFNVYLHAIDRKAYEFYTQAARLISDDGTLYDQVPAPLEGNVYAVDNPQQAVWGYVEFSLVDTARIKIRQDQIKIRLQDDCRPLSGPVCQGIPPVSDEVYCKCWDCDKVFGERTDERPAYWQ